jgi:glucokinase
MADGGAIGIDVGGTMTKGGLVTADGEMILRVEHPTDKSAGTKSILGVAEELVANSSEADITVEAIGIGAAGFIDAGSGSVTFAPNLEYDDPEIGAALRSQFDLPVIVDNDANAAAWGELHFGAGRGMKHMVLIGVGTGIGGAVVADGRLVRGATGAGAELGHIVIEMNGPLCGCGLRGCFEAMASGTAIARIAREGLPDHPESVIEAEGSGSEPISAKDVSAAAHAGDEFAAAILRRAGLALGTGLSNMANLFDPESIVLSGSVINAGEFFLGPARDELVRMTAAQRRRPMRIDVSTLGADAGIIGAAALALIDETEGEP